MSTGRTDVAGRTTTARARLAPQATSDYDELMEGFREVRQYVDSTLQMRTGFWSVSFLSGVASRGRR